MESDPNAGPNEHLNPIRCLRCRARLLAPSSENMATRKSLSKCHSCASPLFHLPLYSIRPRYSIHAGALKDFSTADKSRVYASKDFRSLKAELGGSDRLLLFTVVAVGTQRSYYGFIPISSPSAMMNARGEIIDLQTNEVLWRQTTTDVAAIDDPWDESPEFRNVHAAVQKVILAARKSMADLLFAGLPAGAAAAK